MSEFNLGDKVIAIAYRTDHATGQTFKKELTSEIIEKDSLGCYRLADNHWYTEDELQHSTEYQRQKMKLNV